MKKYFLLLAATAAMILTGCTKTESEFETEQYFHQETFFLPSSESDSLVIDITIEMPIKMKDEALLSKLQASITKELFGDFAQLDASAAMEAYVAEIKSEYVADNQDAEEIMSADEEVGGMFCADEILIGQVMGMQRGIFCYGIERYIMNGDSHGNNNRTFFNYCSLTGEPVALADLMEAGYEDALTEQIVSSIRKDNDVTSDKELEELGYFVDQITPTDNFYFTDSTIVFVYNPFDIAAYTVGETVVELPLSNVEPMLKSPEGEK